jgi:hypothetical protein
MTNLTAVTRSTTVTVTDPSAVRALCQRHAFGGLNWTITDDDQFRLWGHTTPDILPTTDTGTSDYDAEDVTIGFMQELAAYLADGAVLDIQSAGFEGCRYPLHGYRLVVTHDELRAYHLFAPGTSTGEAEPAVEIIHLTE